MGPDKIKDVPTKPGVYIFKSAKGHVIYVGKAKNLKNRLRSYFQHAASLDARKASMTKLISDFSYIITGNELEALILEANLIKQYKPRFNIILRDDKTYPYLKLTMAEEWPRIEVVRRIIKDKSLYFGPYVPSHSMWDALAFIRRNFPVRTCRYSLDRTMRPCIEYEMGRCIAPCANKVSRDAYMKLVDKVRLFLKGERKGLVRDMEKRMNALSDELKFEEAAQIRDRIKNLRKVWETQRIVSPGLGDMDVIGFYSDSADTAFEVLFIRNGILTGTKDFFIRGAGKLPDKEILKGFIEMFYIKELIPPDKIIVRHRPEDMHNLKEWLKEKKGAKVDIISPQKGKKMELLRMSEENAVQVFRNRKALRAEEVQDTLKDRLGLPHLPGSIAAFDVSTLSGSESVGAYIYWTDGEFIKDKYRRLRIKGVAGIDDYSMMSETIERTLKDSEDLLPDLIIIDGGKGHLEIACEAIRKNRIVHSNGLSPMIIAVAKDPDRAITISHKVIGLEDNSPSSLLLKKIRDEVHRFAISYHKKLRDKKLTESPLERVHGIAKKRRLELLRHFGSIEAIRNAELEDILKIKGFNRPIAEKLLKELRTS